MHAAALPLHAILVQLGHLYRKLANQVQRLLIAAHYLSPRLRRNTLASQRARSSCLAWFARPTAEASDSRGLPNRVPRAFAAARAEGNHQRCTEEIMMQHLAYYELGTRRRSTSLAS